MTSRTLRSSDSGNTRPLRGKSSSLRTAVRMYSGTARALRATTILPRRDESREGRFELLESSGSSPFGVPPLYLLVRHGATRLTIGQALFDMGSEGQLVNKLLERNV